MAQIKSIKKKSILHFADMWINNPEMDDIYKNIIKVRGKFKLREFYF